ncbi:MAG: hypothetical protein R2744_11925 [Bacteroidales bacterium]
MENCLPADYEKEAVEKNIDIHELLTNKAKKLVPGESGLPLSTGGMVNRSVLVDVDLTE